jgi:3-phosphoglycerate kinase
MKPTMNDLRTAELKGKRVLYRPDYNVPMIKGAIHDDFRIEATFPTIDYLMEHGAKIIIVTHMGRPDGKEDPEFDLRPIAERIADQYPGHTVQMAHQIEHEDVQKAIGNMKEADIILLPNVRFYPQEEANDETFGHMLALLADLYVNDAFAVDHRAHASLVWPEKFIPSYPGFLLERELEMLGKLIEKPAHPMVVIMGGAKVKDKIGAIENIGKDADHILIGGAMANTFLLAKGEDVSESKAEKEEIDVAKNLMEKFGDKLVLAKDFVKKDLGDGKFSYLDIGDGAVEEFKGILKDAKTIFWNGSLGYTEEEEYAKASKAIAEFIGGLKDVTSIVAGGDTVDMVNKLNIYDHFTFVSTGGGAALELLAG